MDADAKAMVKEKIPERDRADAAGGEEMKKKKNKINYNFTKETCCRIAERDGNECIFCKLGYHMDKCRSEMLLGIPDIMHYINKSQGGLGIEENGVLGCRFHHGLLDNGNLGLRPEMLEIMKEHLMQQYPDWSEDKLVYKKWDFPTFG